MRRSSSTDDAMINALRTGASFRAACRVAQVPYSTAYNWRAKDPRFSALLTQARAHGLAQKANIAIAPWTPNAA